MWGLNSNEIRWLFMIKKTSFLKCSNLFLKNINNISILNHVLDDDDDDVWHPQNNYQQQTFGFFPWIFFLWLWISK